MFTADKWQGIRLILADYLRRVWIMVALDAFCHVCFVLLWAVATALASDVQPVWAGLAIVIYLLGGSSQLPISLDADRKVLRCLPISRADRGLAVWLQIVMLPLCLCTALSVPPLLLTALSKISFVDAIQSFALLTVVNAFSLSAWAMWPGCLQPLLRRLGATGRIKRVGWLALLIMLSLMGFGGALLGWLMTVLPPNGAIAFFGAAAALCACVSLYFRDHLDVVWSAADANPPGGAELYAVPVLSTRKWPARNALWLGTLRMGVSFGAIMALIVLCGTALELKMHSNHSDKAPGTALFAVFATGLLGYVTQLPSLRALRMQPVSMDRFVRILIAVQIAPFMPCVVFLCVGALFLGVATGDIIRSSMIVVGALGGAALLLLSTPLIFRYWEKVFMVAALAAIFGIDSVHALMQTTREVLGNAVIILPPLAAMAAAASLVFCFREIRKFLHTDTRAYLKRSTFFLWRDW